MDVLPWQGILSQCITHHHVCFKSLTKHICQLYLNEDRKSGRKVWVQVTLILPPVKQFLVTSLPLGQKVRAKRKERVPFPRMLQSVCMSRQVILTGSYILFIRTGRGIITGHTSLCTLSNHGEFGCSIRHQQTIAHGPNLAHFLFLQVLFYCNT